MAKPVYSNWTPRENSDADGWFGKLYLFNVLDNLQPLGTEDFIDGWTSLASYLKLEFGRWR